MSFPTTSVIDQFNRANGTLVTGNWAGFASGYYGSVVLQITSNIVTSNDAANAGASKWSASTFGPDTEAFVTLVSLPADTHYMEFWLRANDTDASNPFGYRIIYTYSAGGTDNVKIYRQDNGSTVTLLATINQDYAAGDKIGASIVGTVITVYRFTAAAWGSVGTYDTSGDGTKYSSAGYVVMVARDQTVALDDFGGGTNSNSILDTTSSTRTPIDSFASSTGVYARDQAYAQTDAAVVALPQMFIATDGTKVATTSFVYRDATLGRDRVIWAGDHIATTDNAYIAAPGFFT